MIVGTKITHFRTRIRLSPVLAIIISTADEPRRIPVDRAATHVETVTRVQAVDAKSVRTAALELL